MFQSVVIAISTITAAMSVYFKLSETKGLNVYNTILTTITFKEKLFEIRALDVLGTGSILLSVFELYWLIILINFYTQTKRRGWKNGIENKMKTASNIVK